MTPLQEFANTIMKARKAVNADRGIGAWLVFHETKQSAHAKLMGALPQLKEIQDFWRYVQSMRVAEWLPVIEAQLARITRWRSLCHDCGAAEISWPERRCVHCRKARRLDTYRKAKDWARAKRRMRKCPVCSVALLNRRERVCPNCQANGRRERNRRYQKSLKDRKLRRLQPDSTTGGGSTVPLSKPATMLAQNVERKSVLAGGVA
jgi:hypothetical protein